MVLRHRRQAGRQELRESGLLNQNLAPLVLMNMGIPGPWHIIHSTPDMVSLYEYPMALAPTTAVPIFIVINGVIINYLLSQKQKR